MKHGTFTICRWYQSGRSVHVSFPKQMDTNFGSVVTCAPYAGGGDWTLSQLWTKLARICGPSLLEYVRIFNHVACMSIQHPCRSGQLPPHAAVLQQLESLQNHA